MKHREVIAVIIAVTVSVILVAAVLSPLLTGREMSESKAQLVVSVLMIYIGILVNHMGEKRPEP